MKGKMNNNEFKFNTIEEGIEDLKAGKMLIVVDDPDRENEGDLVIAAELVTSKDVNFITREGRGILCLPVTEEKANALPTPPILAPAPAALLVYGQGEKPVLEIARRLAMGEDVCGLVDVPGTAVALADLSLADLPGRGRGVLTLPSFEEVAADRKTFAFFSRLYHLEHNHENARILVQRHGRGEGQRFVVVNQPMAPPTTEELDRVYDLPWEREAHPS